MTECKKCNWKLISKIKTVDIEIGGQTKEGVSFAFGGYESDETWRQLKMLFICSECRRIASSEDL